MGRTSPRKRWSTVLCCQAKHTQPRVTTYLHVPLLPARQLQSQTGDATPQDATLAQVDLEAEGVAGRAPAHKLLRGGCGAATPQPPPPAVADGEGSHGVRRALHDQASTRGFTMCMCVSACVCMCVSACV